MKTVVTTNDDLKNKITKKMVPKEKFLFAPS